VNPVVEGSVRARQHRRKDRKGEQCCRADPRRRVGRRPRRCDETLNLSQTRGYGTGGTVAYRPEQPDRLHTSDPPTAVDPVRTDVMKMVDAPIFHVNGDDPEPWSWRRDRPRLPHQVQEGRGRSRVLPQARPHEQDEPMVTQP